MNEAAWPFPEAAASEVPEQHEAPRDACGWQHAAALTADVVELLQHSIRISPE
jgi:hypothetical protein